MKRKDLRPGRWHKRAGGKFEVADHDFEPLSRFIIAEPWHWQLGDLAWRHFSRDMSEGAWQGRVLPSIPGRLLILKRDVYSDLVPRGLLQPKQQCPCQLAILRRDHA